MVRKHDYITKRVYERLYKRYPNQELRTNWVYEKGEIDVLRIRNERNYYPYEIKTSNRYRNWFKALQQLKRFNKWVKSEGLGKVILSYLVVPFNKNDDRIIVYPMNTLTEKDFEGLERILFNIKNG
jgi:hypothetical protein